MTLTERLKDVQKRLSYVGEMKNLSPGDYETVLVSIIKDARGDGTEEERNACAAHADSVARTSALLPKDDPERDGPQCARHIERLIRARSS